MAPAQSFTGNLFLSRLDASDYDLLQAHLERVSHSRGDDLMRPNEPIDYVHFPEGGVVSLVAEEGDATIEIGLIGREGFTGAPVLLGSDISPDRCFVQIDSATALRIPTALLLAATEQSEALRLRLLRFVHVQAVQAARTAASNAANELPQRLARWLLMCHDRLDGDELQITHEFMSMMLGVRRSGVTVSLHLLEGMSAISGRRGAILVRDRSQLERIAGEAYGPPEAEYRRLIGPFGKS